MHPKHLWTVRLSIAMAMLLLAFIGIMATNILSTGAWVYWKAIVPIYGALALFLSWYVRRTTDVVKPITLWHELLHWIGLILAIFLVEIYVDCGLLSRTLASLFALTLISLTVFTIGIYIETTLILVGIILGIFAAVVALTIEYLYAFTIPILLVGASLISYVIWRSHKKNTQKPH